MVQVVTRENRASFAHALAGMHRDRKAVFVDQLGWDVPVVEGAYEIDQYDGDAAVYLLVQDGAGGHLGSVRLLPTTGPHLLGEVFPHLCDGAVPAGPDIWEITRFCINPAAADVTGARRQLMVGVIEFALLYGVRRYTMVTHMQFLSRLLAVGWDCRPLGLPSPDGADHVGAMEISVTPETLSLVRQRVGFSAPVLRWIDRHAA